MNLAGPCEDAFHIRVGGASTGYLSRDAPRRTFVVGVSAADRCPAGHVQDGWLLTVER
jgi:hypothetical protein